MKGVLTIFLALVMALSFTACGGETEEELELPSAQEIVDGAIKSLTNTRTYQFDMDMTMDMAGEVEGEAGEATMVMDASGAIDYDNQELMMDMTMTMEVPGEDEMEMAMAIYIIEDMMYMMMDMPLMGMGTTWTKSKVPEGTWEAMSGQVDQTELLLEILDAAQVNLAGSEIVSGTDCYVVEVTPDVEKLWQIAEQQMQLAGDMDEIPDITGEVLQDIIRSFSVKYWIAKKTYFITKMDMAMTMEMTPEAWGSAGEEGEIDMDVKISMLMYNHNQPVSIVLPPEAEEAVEAPMQP